MGMGFEHQPSRIGRAQPAPAPEVTSAMQPVQEILITSFEESFFLSGFSLKKDQKCFRQNVSNKRWRSRLGPTNAGWPNFGPKNSPIVLNKLPNWCLKCIRNWHPFAHLYFFTALLTARFPTAGLLAAQVRADWLLDWSLAAKWTWLLIYYLADAIPTHQISKNDKNCCSLLLMHENKCLYYFWSKMK